MHSSGKPHVETDLCIGCGMCSKICAHDAPVIKNGKAKIDHSKCVGCGRCDDICPEYISFSHCVNGLKKACKEVMENVNNI